MPLIYSLSDIKIFNLNYDIFVPTVFIIISVLLISKIPTYALKKITVKRNLTIFLLLGVVLYFGLILIYTLNAIAISGLLYIIMIPVSLIHFNNLNKKYKSQEELIEEHEDIL